MKRRLRLVGKRVEDFLGESEVVAKALMIERSRSTTIRHLFLPFKKPY